jgi:hypothetical protein
MADMIPKQGFTQWLAGEHHPITEVPITEHRVSIWYEPGDLEWDGEGEMEELLSLTFWQVTAIWEGLQLFEEVAKARLQAATNSGQRDLRKHGKVVESCVMAKRKLSCIRRYMASKHQNKTMDPFEEQAIHNALGVDHEGTASKD